ALVLMAMADWRLGIPTVLWFAGYIFFLRHFVPRMRDLAKTSSELRSLVMGRVVDSYTNILTVKLFARARDEDAYVREVVDEHTAAWRAQLRLGSLWIMVLQLLNALLMVGTGALAILLWRGGYIAIGVVATAIPLAWQITNMLAFVAQHIASIFDDLGQVQDGMRSIAVERQMADLPGAAALPRVTGAI